MTHIPDVCSPHMLLHIPPMNGIPLCFYLSNLPVRHRSSAVISVALLILNIHHKLTIVLKQLKVFCTETPLDAEDHSLITSRTLYLRNCRADHSATLSYS